MCLKYFDAVVFVSLRTADQFKISLPNLIRNYWVAEAKLENGCAGTTHKAWWQSLRKGFISVWTGDLLQGFSTCGLRITGVCSGCRGSTSRLRKLESDRVSCKSKLAVMGPHCAACLIAKQTAHFSKWSSWNIGRFHDRRDMDLHFNLSGRYVQYVEYLKSVIAGT